VAAHVPADLSRLHVVVPVRGSGVGKSRLGGALDPEERLALVVGMLVQTLATLSAWPAVEAVHVVTADPLVRRLVRASDTGTHAIADEDTNDLNEALIRGRDRAISRGASAVLFLPADLPQLTTEALDGLLEAADAALAAGSGSPIVVVAPADARVGTNALLVAPPDTIDPLFGEASLEAHARAAAVADASVQLVHDPALGFDLDTPDDLEHLDTIRLLEIQALGQAALDGLAGPVTSAGAA
jgi:2-phospho-L-lactate guanylyltransferase